MSAHERSSCAHQSISVRFSMLPQAMHQSPPEAGQSRFDRGSHFNRVVSPFSISMIQLISRSLRSSAHHSSRDRLYSQCLVSAYRAFQSKHTFFVSYSRQRLGLICTKVKQCTVLTPLPFPPSSPPILSPTICKVFPHPSPFKIMEYGLWYVLIGCDHLIAELILPEACFLQVPARGWERCPHRPTNSSHFAIMQGQEVLQIIRILVDPPGFSHFSGFLH